MSLGYYPKGATILAPDQREPGFFYIIQRGLVQVGPHRFSGGSAVTLGPGECFSVGALVEKRPVSSPYTAVADTFCYALAAGDFYELLHRSSRAQDFATNHLTSMLRASRRLLKMNFSSVTAEQQAMARSLRSLIKRSPVSCEIETPIGEALRAIHQAKVGSIVVVSPQGAPMGIFTHHDAIDRVALAQADLTRPIAYVMTPHPLPAEASAHDAALAMARHGIRHVLVVDENRLIGIVTEHDLFTLQRVSMRQINEAIADASCATWSSTSKAAV